MVNPAALDLTLFLDVEQPSLILPDKPARTPLAYAAAEVRADLETAGKELASIENNEAECTLVVDPDLEQDNVYEYILPSVTAVLAERYKKYRLTSKQMRFLAAVVGTAGNLRRAAKACGFSVFSHYNWIADQPRYKEAYEMTKELANEALLLEAIRRATQGTLKPHFYQDKVVGYVREYSDTLLLALLKAKFPNEFKDRSESTITAAVEAVRKLDPGVDSLPQDKLERLLQLANRAAGATN